MRVLLQRVTASEVTVNGKVIGKIGRGLNLLVGISQNDTEEQIDWMARKCLQLRVFPDEAGKLWQYSVQDIGGDILAVSQFTLYGDCRKGRRPSFDASAAPDRALAHYYEFVKKLRASGLRVETGEFGATMEVAIANDGPVTLLLER
ncbi:D-aminoacyl-tRNA deacylase [Geitlerinema sp. PCC 9228]|jgi:D-tyrosyl-tRNA(Tyr) deacylase|uniref:D-aminoacyl-tRNA deacylase n=1 Tax=Geitlerinema sp. PCC 9228 TaxID=111611 RepID=UPI0008F9D357|nr:D-aminoacyl-tRNA deacylase [Geitlerinema sp. PCC 9228]